MELLDIRNRCRINCLVTTIELLWHHQLIPKKSIPKSKLIPNRHKFILILFFFVVFSRLDERCEYYFFNLSEKGRKSSRGDRSVFTILFILNRRMLQ